MGISSLTEMVWPSGDCIPVLATELDLTELSRRIALNIFRDKDDLDWFVGAVYNGAPIGPILIMRHDNNPKRLTAFYVDSHCGVNLAQAIVIEMFGLKNDEIAWRCSQN